MKPWLIVAALLLAGVSCGRKADSSTQSPTAKAAVVSEAPAADGGMSARLAELTQLVRKYGLEQRSAPKSFDDLVAKGYLNAKPVAPDGKRFVINKTLEVTLE